MLSQPLEGNGAGEMTKSTAALAEDWSLFSSTNLAAHNSSAWRSDALFWLPEVFISDLY